MKQLIIARHAKSSWKHNTCPDFDRGLNERGKKDVGSIGLLLAKHIKIPNLILSSPAKRAKKTTLVYATSWGYKKKNISWEKDIYEASLSTLVDVIEHVDEHINRLLLVGHNPGLTELVRYCGYDLENLPTCGVVLFEYRGNFRGNFEQNRCAFVAKFFPKEIE